MAAIGSHELMISSRGAWLRTFLGVGVLAMIALAGYAAFVVFVTSGSSLAGAGFIVVAVVAGAGAFFSPCAFPFLPGYFAYAQALSLGAAPRRSFGPLASGSIAAAGVIAFNVLLGLAFGLAGLGIAQSLQLVSPTPSPATVALRAGVGGVWIGLGVAQLADLSLHGERLGRLTGFLQSLSERRGAVAKLFLYGFS